MTKYKPTGAGALASLNPVDSLAYLFETNYGQNPYRPRIIDLCYTAFMMAKQPNKEDGGASDWFTDTKPHIDRLINEMAVSTRTQPSAPQEASEVDRKNWLEGNFKIDYSQRKPLLPRHCLDYCPVCKRDIFPPERLFNLKTDNHVERCIEEPKAAIVAYTRKEG